MAQTKQTAADLVVYGKIYTSKDGQVAEAFAAKDGKYVYVGDKAGAQAYVKEGATQVIDYSGKGLVMPGCGNGHAHYPMGFAINLVGVVVGADATPKDFLDEIIPDAVRKARETGATSIFGFGWSLVNFQNDMPTRQDLDAICVDIPIYIADNEGHKALTNTCCLVNAGYMTEDGAVLVKEDSIRGGEIVMGADGTPCGYLKETAGTRARAHLDNDAIYPVSIAKTVLDKVQQHLLSEGYTMFMDGWTNYFYNDNTYKAAQEMDEAGDLHVVLGLNYELESWMDLEEGLQAALESRKYASKHVLPKWVKLFIDGTVETGTGYVDPVYPDGHNGEPIWTEEEVTRVSEVANNNDMTVHVHTMGNKACNLAVNGFINGGKDEMRNIIVHVYNIDDADLERMAEHDIYATSGMLWHHGKRENIAAMRELGMVPMHTVGKSYPMKSFFDFGVTLTGHTDYPALSGSPDDPFGMMEIAVTGVLAGEDGDPYWPEELLTREQYLTAMTINVAKQLYLEDERGSITKGKYADFILLDTDVLTCPVDEIHKAKVQATYFEGEKVFSR